VKRGINEPVKEKCVKRRSKAWDTAKRGRKLSKLVPPSEIRNNIENYEGGEEVEKRVLRDYLPKKVT